jgi:hypothetical protein
VIIVVLQNLPQKLMLGMVDGFYDIFIVSGEIEEASALPWGT